MLRRYQALWRTLFLAADVGLSLGVFLLSYEIRFHPAVVKWLPLAAPRPPLLQYVRLLPVLALILLLSNRYHRLYTPRREGSLWAELADILKATALSVLLLTAFLFFERVHS